MEKPSTDARRAIGRAATLLRAGIALAVCAASAQVPAGSAGDGRQPGRDTAQATSLRASDRIRALEKESEALAQQEKSLLVELRQLEVDRQLRTEQLRLLESQMADTRRAADEATARIGELQRTADAERPQLEARLARIYRMGRAGYWRLLLDVSDVRAVGRAYRTAAAMTRLDQDRVQQHRATLAALARERQVIEQRRAEQERLRTETQQARAALDRAVAARTALVASIDARRDLNAQLAGELLTAQQRLQAEVAQLGTAASATALPLRAFRGALPWPAQGVVIGRFGQQRSVDGRPASSPNGLVISLSEGQTVRAVHEGTVAFAGQFTGFGNLVIIDHGGGALSLYGQLGAMAVGRGDGVEAQATLGSSGRDPAGNPSLYFELRIDGRPVDPVQWLKKP